MVHLPRDERKARLAEATWQIIVDRGIGAVSVRTVAAEAGMPVGSLRHLFPTQAELLEFSAELMVDRATTRVSAIVPDPDGVEYALSAISELLPLTAQTRREFEINIALIAQTPTNPGLARIRDHAHEQLLELFTRITAMLRKEAEPTPASHRDARRLLALVDGLGLHLSHQDPDGDTQWAVSIVKEELIAIAPSATNGT